MGYVPTFELTLEVNDADIDDLGHASNISYVRWIQNAAVAHSEAVGLDIASYQKLGAIFVIVRHEIDYLRPALRGAKLKARTWISSVSAASCQRATEISCAAQGTVHARATTTWAFVEVATGRPRRIAEPVRLAFYPASVA